MDIYPPSPDLAMTSRPSLVPSLEIPSSSFPFVGNNNERADASFSLRFVAHLYMTDRKYTFVASSTPDLYYFSCSIHIHNHKNTFIFGPLNFNDSLSFSNSSLVPRDLSSDQSIIPLSISIRNREMHRAVRRGNLSIR